MKCKFFIFRIHDEIRFSPDNAPHEQEPLIVKMVSK